MREPGENEPVNYVNGMTRREVLRRSALGAVLVAPALGMLLPEEAQAQLLGRPSVAQQKQLGAQAAQQILQKYPEVHDQRATHFKEVGQRLVSSLPAADRGKWDWSYRVLESNEVNAFALPGGPMFLFTGLYKLMESDDEMAAVTGHEMTHVRDEHWAKAYGKGQERNMVIALGLSLFHAGRAAQTVAGLADNLIGLKYSRNEEDLADAGGLSNIVAAGYNPQGMLQLFRTLERVGGSSKHVGGDFLSDHPMTSARIQRTRQRIVSNYQRRRFNAPIPLNYRALQG